MRFGQIGALVFACVACSGSPTTIRPSPPDPSGLLWATSPRPWHVARTTHVIGLDRDRAVLGSTDGWISEVDLRTGLVTRERRFERMGYVAALARLRDGRWLAVGPGDQHEVQAMVFDDTTATPITLPLQPDTTRQPPGLAMLADGAVVITGTGLPLASYDSTTWTVRTVIDPALGWSRPRIDGAAVIAERNNTLVRFALGTGERTERAFRGSNETTKLQAELALRQLASFEVTEDVAGFVTGARLVIAMPRRLEIRAMPSGAVTTRIALSEHWFAGALAMDDRRVVFMSDRVIRVVDLASGELTPIGEAPWGSLRALAVNEDGLVAVFGEHHAWQFANATLRVTDRFDESRVLGDPDDPSRYLLDTPRRTELRTFGRRKPIASWALDGVDGWLGTNGAAILDIPAGYPGLVYRVEGASESVLLAMDPDSRVLDATPDTRDALVGYRGTVEIVRAGKPTATRVRMPGCRNFGNAAFERGGSRIVTWTTDVLASWDRDGTLIAAVHAPSEIRAVRFVPGRPELVVLLETGIVLWTPAQTRAVAFPSASHVAISRGGHRLAVFGQRLALFDYDTLRDHATPVAPFAMASIPACDAEGLPGTIFFPVPALDPVGNGCSYNEPNCGDD